MNDEKKTPPKKTVAFWIFVALASPFALIAMAATVWGVGEMGNLRLSLAPVFFGIAFGAACVTAFLAYMAYRFGLVHDPPLPKPGIRVLLLAMLVVSLLAAGWVIFEKLDAPQHPDGFNPGPPLPPEAAG